MRISHLDKFHTSRLGPRVRQAVRSHRAASREAAESGMGHPARGDGTLVPRTRSDKPGGPRQPNPDQHGTTRTRPMKPAKTTEPKTARHSADQI
jgi:hypothetical protein